MSQDQDLHKKNVPFTRPHFKQFRIPIIFLQHYLPEVGAGTDCSTSKINYFTVTNCFSNQFIYHHICFK